MRKIFPHICLIFCVLFLTHINLAQDKSKKDIQKSSPTLFDTYSETYSETSDYSESLLTAYIDRFAKALKEAPETTKGVVINYLFENEEHCSQEISTPEKRFDFVRKSLIEKHKISPDRILSDFAMARESTELEFWIMPKGAKMPIASPTVIMDRMCGELSISGIEKVDSNTQFIYFYAFVSGADEIEYKWTVSAGKIVEGQGSTRIKVDISSVTAQEVEATVEAQDKCSEICNLKDSFTTKIVP